MQKFARVFDLPAGQLLVTIDFGDEDGSYEMAMLTQHEGVQMRVASTCGERQQAVDWLESMSQERAEEIHTKLLNAIENPSAVLHV